MVHPFAVARQSGARRAMHDWIRLAVLAPLLSIGACATHRTTRTSAGAPSMLIGEFRDDYRGRFTISDSTWFQRPRNQFRIVRWDMEQQFLIAQNAANDPTAPNLWTRIDWMPLTDQQPYTWGFCLTAYNAPSREAALATPAAIRATPRTGCNGFPFSRMQRVTATDSVSTR